MTIKYEQFPPTENDVRLDLEFAYSVNKDAHDGLDLSATGFSDTHQFATDMQFNDAEPDHEFYNDRDHMLLRLRAVQRGMSKAAEALTKEDSRAEYLAGMSHFLSIQVVG